MNKDGSISINQTVHGYDNGHSLLASSIDLPNEVRRKMLPITDMSGNSMLDGFEDYLTAYPIKDINAFAIGKTWYADEMERPGCVWTHTLIISFVDLPLLLDTEVIFGLFKRPNGSQDTDAYKYTISVNLHRSKKQNNNSWLEKFTPSVVKTAIAHLYNGKNQSVLIRTSNTSNFDKLIFAIWSQQWPRLKRNFSFCTGAIEPRSLDKQYLDIQIVPYRAFRENSSFSIIDSIKSSEPPKESFDKWIDLIYEDLKSPSLLRDFLSTFGADVAVERRAFKLLAECFLFFDQGRPSLEDAMDFICTRFNSATEAFTLKSIVLDLGQPDKQYYLPKYQEDEILHFLSTTQLYPTLDYTKLRFESRVLDYFYSRPIVAARLLERVLEAELNPLGENVFRTLAGQLEANKIAYALEESPNLLTVLISLNPALAYSRDFWNRYSSRRMEIIQTLERTNHDLVDWPQIIGFLLDNQIAIDPKTFNLSESETVTTILDWITLNPDIPLANVWTDYLEQHTESVIPWLSYSSSSARSVSLIINFLNPNSKIVVATGARPWLAAIAIMDREENHWLKSDLASFCLPLAFNLSGTDAMKLIIFSFETVYHLLAKNQLSFRYWNFLEPHTKPLSIFKDWDKCKKIVHTLVDHTVKNGFEIRYIVDRIDDFQIKDRIMRRYAKVR